MPCKTKWHHKLVPLRAWKFRCESESETANGLFISLHSARRVKVNIGISPLDLNRWDSLLDKGTAAGSITATSSGPTSCGCHVSFRRRDFPAYNLYNLYTCTTRVPVQIVYLTYLYDCPKKYRPKLNLTYRTARNQGVTRTFTGSLGLPWALHAVPMFQCCRCYRLFSRQKAVTTHCHSHQ